jgi:hypothetical protein
MTLVRRVLQFREHNVASTTPITTYFEFNHRCPIKPNAIMLVLHHTLHLIGPAVGLVESDVSTHSLRAGAAMTLQCAQVDANIIRLLAHWQSDAMLRYLHVQACPIMRNVASQILQHGMYDLIQNVQQQNPQGI